MTLWTLKERTSISHAPSAIYVTIQAHVTLRFKNAACFVRKTAVCERKRWFNALIRILIMCPSHESFKLRSNKQACGFWKDFRGGSTASRALCTYHRHCFTVAQPLIRKRAKARERQRNEEINSLGLHWPSSSPPFQAPEWPAAQRWNEDAWPYEWDNA